MEEQKRDMTAATIYFRRHDRKMLEMIVFIANLAGDEGIDIYHLAKVFFYAEKRHLNQYWRPIVGDIYIKMPYGPGPSAVLDLINMLEMSDRDDMIDRFKRKFDQKLIELAQDALLVERNDKGHNEIKAKRQPNEDYLSDSDKEAINWAYKRYAARSFNALMDESHQEQIKLSSSQASCCVLLIRA